MTAYNVPMNEKIENLAREEGASSTRSIDAHVSAQSEGLDVHVSRAQKLLEKLPGVRKNDTIEK